MERSILEISRGDRERNTWIREKTNVTYVVDRFVSLKWVYVARTREKDTRTLCNGNHGLIEETDVPNRWTNDI